MIHIHLYLLSILFASSVPCVDQSVVKVDNDF